MFWGFTMNSVLWDVQRQPKKCYFCGKAILKVNGKDSGSPCEHHVSYNPEVKVDAHVGCHARFHKKNKIIQEDHVTHQKKPKKGRSPEEKVGRRKWIIGTLKRMERRQKIIDRRTRMLAAGLRGLFMLGEDYVSMVACTDEVDVAILYALRLAGVTGRQSGELAAQLDIDHRNVSRRIYGMNRRMDLEIGENIIEKQGHKWKLIPRLRRDFAAEKGVNEN